MTPTPGSGRRPACPLTASPSPQPPLRESAEAEAWRGRGVMLREMARGLLMAVAYCHRLGVVHGSISCGSVFISSCEDADAPDLLVKVGPRVGARVVCGGGGPRGGMVRKCAAWECCY